MTAKNPDVCGAAGCSARDPFPLHHARDHVNRAYFRLCSSCLLKNSAGSFCSFCFDLLDAAAAAAATPPVVHCSKCPSVSHPACIPSPTVSPEFVCPSCSSSPGFFSYFKNENGRTVDLQSAKVFLAASKIASNSMRRRAVVARSDVDKKVRESAVAWKRARHMLESANVVCNKEKMKEKEKENGDKNESRGNEEEERRRKEQKRAPSREIEKWMRFHEPIPRGGFLIDSKSRVRSVSREEKRKKDSILSNRSGGC